jgi:L-asparaginase
MNLRYLAFLIAGLLASAALPAAGPDAEIDRPALPVVLLVATGGTIAGVQNVADDPDRYRAGSLSAEQVVESVPKLKDYARIETLQFSNVPSALITPAMWMDLSRRIEAVLTQRDDVAGVVVTHGTDRLEETAFFLYLTVRSDKPVVLVGAQRPATGLSPDGPQNLLDAVRTAVAPGAVGKGVLVAMDGRILSAREVRKLYQRVGGFSTGDMGMLGLISHAGAEFFFAPARPHGKSSEFDLAAVEALPAVDLLFSYSGGQGPRYETPPAGIVVSNTSFTCEEMLAYLQLARAGTIVVTAFPSGDNVGRRWPPRDSVPAEDIDHCRHIDEKSWEGPWIPPIVATHLTPQKARILLMLALGRTSDDLEIRKIFERY